MTNNAASAPTFEEWTGEASPQAVSILSGKGGLIVSPTKVGYILMATDGEHPRDQLLRDPLRCAR